VEGGYNSWSVARCWAGVWATINGFEMPDVLPPEAESVMRGLTWQRAGGRNPPDRWFTTLADPVGTGAVRQAVRELVSRAHGFHVMSAEQSVII
jgi:acetoin utilization protein AcuC